MVGGLSTGLARDALDAAGTAALLLAASTLLVRRAVAVRSLCACQIAACACAVLAHGAASGEPLLAAAAAVLMASKGALIWPALSRREAVAPAVVATAAVAPAAVAPAPVAPAVVATAAALVLLALFAARQSTSLPPPAASNGAAAVLGLVLIGPLIAAARPVAPWTVAGVLSIETGATLAAVAISPAAAAVETIAVLLAAASIAAILRLGRDNPGGA